MDSLYSHDIETEEEKQTAVLKDIERVTGARSVAVTRYGSYESKMHGRNQLGTIKQESHPCSLSVLCHTLHDLVPP